MTTSAPATDGTAPLGDRRPDKTGFVPSLALTESPGIVWRFPRLGEKGRFPGISDPATANGMLFFGDDFGVVRALTAKHGATIWSHKHGQRVFFPPTSDGQRLYFTTSKGLTALEADTGLPVWHQTIEHGAGRCVIYGQTVFCAGQDGWAYAFDGPSGEQKWKVSMVDDAPRDPPGFDGDRARFQGTAARPTGIATDGQLVYQSVFDQCRVIALECQSGRRRFSFQTGGWIFGDPAVDDQKLFVGSQDKHCYCFDKTTGKLLWKHATKSRIESGLAVDKDRVYVASCDGSVYCFWKESGERVWTFATDAKNGSAFYSAPIVTQDSIYLAAAEGQVYALDAATGALRWKLRPSQDSRLYTSPATDGTRIFVKSRPNGDGENAIFAIGPSQP